MTYNWRDEAACKDGNPDDFCIPDSVSSGRAAHFGRLVPKFEQSIKKYCASCPVILQCRDDATFDDVMYTIRGGVLPGQLTRELESDKSPDRVRGSRERKYVWEYNLSAEETARFENYLSSRSACKNGHPIVTMADVAVKRGPSKKKGDSGTTCYPYCWECVRLRNMRDKRRSRGKIST